MVDQALVIGILGEIKDAGIVGTLKLIPRVWKWVVDAFEGAVTPWFTNATWIETGHAAATLLGVI